MVKWYTPHIKDFIIDSNFYEIIKNYTSKKIIFGQNSFDKDDDDGDDSGFSKELDEIKKILNARKHQFDAILPDLKVDDNDNGDNNIITF